MTWFIGVVRGPILNLIWAFYWVSPYDRGVRGRLVQTLGHLAWEAVYRCVDLVEWAVALGDSSMMVGQGVVHPH